MTASCMGCCRSFEVNRPGWAHIHFNFMTRDRVGFLCPSCAATVRDAIGRIELEADE